MFTFNLLTSKKKNTKNKSGTTDIERIIKLYNTIFKR